MRRMVDEAERRQSEAETLRHEVQHAREAAVSRNRIIVDSGSAFFFKVVSDQDLHLLLIWPHSDEKCKFRSDSIKKKLNVPNVVIFFIF